MLARSSNRSRRTPIAGAMVAILAAGIAHAQPLATYEMREEWRIVSDESSKDMLLTQVSDLVVLPDGRVVTAHSRETLLRVFDRNGKFLRTVGRRGQGPGEFTSAGSIGLLGDTLWVGDSPRYQLFDLTFTPIGQAGARVSGFNPGLMNGGLALARTRAGGDSQVVVLLDGQGELVRRIPVEVKDGRRRIAASLRGEPINLVVPLGAQAMMALAPGGADAVVVEPAEVWGGRPGQIAIRRFTPDGRVSPPITASLPPRPLPRSVADSVFDAWAENYARNGVTGDIRSKATPPSHFPAFNTLGYFGDGLLWVGHFDQPVRYVVGTDGRLMYEVRLPAGLDVVYADRTRVWGTIPDADGVPMILQYRLERR